MNYKIVTDSCCDLPLDFIKKHDIEIVSLIIQMDGKEYVDDMGEHFNREAFFMKLKEGATASTSQVNLGTYLNVFQKYVEAGVPVLYLSFSSALSGSYNNAVAAAKILEEKYGQTNITIVDTKAASLGEGMLVYQAAKLKAKGKTLLEVADWVEGNKMRLHSWVTVDDIRHLERGGRISSFSATVGTILNVKPIITVNKEGGLISVGKVRGRKKSLQHLIDKTIAGAIHSEESSIFIGHVGVPEEANWIKAELSKKLPAKEVLVHPYGPTIAAHTGFGSVSVFSFGQER